MLSSSIPSALASIPPAPFLPLKASFVGGKEGGARPYNPGRLLAMALVAGKMPLMAAR